jgi:regulator of sirC expression with transglutaminase-like and TPR domain
MRSPSLIVPVPDLSIEGFRLEIAKPDAEISLARAALEVARYRHADLEVDFFIRMLDDFARPLEPLVANAAEPRAALRALNQRLYRELNFQGNIHDYGDARNSYLDLVLERRLGIPITLSIVYLEVARRAGLSLVPVSFPGHFLVKQGSMGGEIVVDPFNQGLEVNDKDLQHLLDGFYQGKVRLERSMLRPATHGETIYRLLNNLKIAHIKGKEPALALAVIDRMLALTPESAVDVRDRGFALHALNRHEEAASELRRYLEMSPGAPDAGQVRGIVDAVERMAEMLK